MSPPALDGPKIAEITGARVDAERRNAQAESCSSLILWRMIDRVSLS
jgi:hypothetical protein